MMQPFFSIVIPTKNRPNLLRDAILSVLWQDFQDYELIVSDNFNDERTKKVVDQFATDPHLKYFRTYQELNMPDHWEFATLKAKGKYVLFLTDRHLLCRGALGKIHQVIQNSSQEISVYTWPGLIFEKFENETGLLRAYLKADNRLGVFSARQLIKEYGNTQRVDYRFPLMLNTTCYREDLAAEIRRRHGRLFWPVGPDITAGFLLLSYIEKLTCLSEPMSVLQEIKDSMGLSIAKYGFDFYLNTLRLDLDNWCRYVPIKASFIHNLIFNDYLTVRAMVSGEQDFADVNWATYFLRCYEDLIYYGIVGFVKNRKEEFVKKWEDALGEFGSDVQSQVKRRMRRAKIWFSIKAYLAKSPFLPFLRRIQNRIFFRQPNKTYRTALEAAGFQV